MAILKPHEGKEEATVNYLREFYTMMSRKQYSRDTLFRDRKHPGLLVHIRLWLSQESRETAQQDPDVHRYWINLGEVAVITTIYEDLDEVFRNYEGPLGQALEADGKE
jgi:hypothetical protein